MKKSTPIICGVDESGRGPIIGPLVMVAFAISQDKLKQLIWMGVKDSKLLSSTAREELFDRVQEVAHDFRVEIIEQDAIDASDNLNWLEAETSARLVSELEPDQVIIDCPSRNIPAYKNYFVNQLSQGVEDKAEIIVQHKADVEHVVVGAASIIAKVIRDRWVDKLRREINIDFGSGYLSDPKTIDFLEKHYANYPYLFRRSWKPYKARVIRGEQMTLGEF